MPQKCLQTTIIAFVLSEQRLRPSPNEMDDPEDAHLQSNPATRRRQSVDQIPSSSQSSSSQSIQAPAATQLHRIQQIASTEFRGLHADMQSHQLKHHNQRVIGLDDHALPLWGHVMEHAPSNADEIQDLSAAAVDIQDTAAQAARTLSSLENAQEAQRQLGQMKVQKTAAVHRKMVEKMETFLQEHPSIVGELQQSGIDLGAVSRNALHAAETALHDVVRSNTGLMNDNKTLEARLSKTSTTTESLKAELAKTSNCLARSRTLHFKAVVGHAALAHKSEHLKQGLSEREEAEQAALNKAERWKQCNESLLETLTEKDTCLQGLDERCHDLSDELSREKNNFSRHTEDLRGQLSTKQDLIDVLEKDVHSLRGQLATKQEVVNTLEEEVDSLQSQLADISNSRSCYREESHRRQLQLTFAEAEIADQKQTTAAVRQNRALVERKLGQAQHRLKTTREDFERLKHDRAGYVRRLRELHLQQEASLQSLRTCQRERTDKAQEAANLKNQLSDKSHEAAELKDQLRDAEMDVVALQRVLRESAEQARATITDKLIEIENLSEDRNSQQDVYRELDAKHQHLRLKASTKVRALGNKLTAAKERIEELTTVVQAHAQDTLDSVNYAESIEFECSRLLAELTFDKAAKAGLAQENASLKRKRSDLQSSLELLQQRLQETGEEIAQLKTQRASVEVRTDKVLRYLVRYSLTIKHKLNLACQLIDSKEKRLKDANQAISAQAIELSDHRYCHEDREALENLRELAETQELELRQVGQRLAGYRKWLNLTCIHESDRDKVDTTALEQCMSEIQALPVGAGFSLHRSSPSAVVQGLTFTYAVHSVKEQATKILVYCFRNPPCLQVADLYSLDQSLAQAKPDDRNAALSMLHAALKVQINYSERAGGSSFAMSMFVLHSMELLCAWCEAALADILELDSLYARVRPLLAVTNMLVRALTAVVEDRLRGGSQNTLPAHLPHEFDHQLQGSGYTYGKYRDDILVLTPTKHIVYVHACQCSVETYDQDDAQAEWLQLPEVGLRLKLHNVPILGTFTSCIWTYAQIGNSMSLFDAALQRTVLNQEPSSPSDAALSLLID
ncbi:hypothetical protein LTR70_005734 [Exophiala xenobiotica]|uniref:Uncharacterized protein n=1 Tax=Lithohypha guttulata TaxID=1690604 RepID=A0ABR0K8T3_9EURO|nr:hypothetical protein LTR24_005471 [Lithohypha guttulata]KAK5317628.1 hypothetical protein LTR70_005734 [Exophiala xenobiotica]